MAATAKSTDNSSSNNGQALGSLQPQTPRTLAGNRSRSPGQGQGQGRVRKLADEWHNTEEMDDGQDEVLDMDVDDEQGDVKQTVTEEKSSSGSRVIDLLDIARPAKPRGIAKEFEVVEGSPCNRVVALPDELLGPEAQDEEWEDIDTENIVEPSRKLYSAVVQDIA